MSFLERHVYLAAILTALLVVATLYLIKTLAPGRIPGLGKAPARDTSNLGVNVLAFPQLPGMVPSFVDQFRAAQVPQRNVQAPV